MAEGGDEWELSKENVQPLKQGRVMSKLQEVLTRPESASHLAIQQQKQAFESEIRFYSGEDPLDVWDRYIRWTEQTFPQGGKESNLSLLLERAVKLFHQEKRYYGDPRYLNLWLNFGNVCSEPLDLYKYLHGQGIGTSLASFYISWAEEYEARGNNKKADAIFQEGLLCKAEPLSKLQCHHRQFQARVAQQVLQGISEGGEVGAGDAGFPEASDPQRVSLAVLMGKGKNKKAPVNRVTDALKPVCTQLPPPQQVPRSSRFKVFDENAVDTPGAELYSLTPQPWAAPPPTRAKENEQRAGTWNSGRHSRTTSALDIPCSLPSFTPYVEESVKQPAITPCKINPTINGVLSARKPGKEEDPLQRVQSQPEEKEQRAMYCKDQVCAGVEEFSFEEIRAEIYIKKIWKKREEDLQTKAQLRVKLEQKIQEMEKKLKEKEDKEEQNLAEELSKPQAMVSSSLDALKSPEEQGEIAVFSPSLSDPVKFPSNKCFSLPSNSVRESQLQQKRQDQVCSVDLGLSASALCTPMQTSFSIFDELLPETQPTRLPVPGARCPLASFSKPQETIPSKEAMPEALDDLAGIEPLNEEAIVTEHKDKTLFPNPEDTCDFIRAAHVVSTPFHGVTTQDEPDPDSDSTIKETQRQPLSERTPDCKEPSCTQAFSVKKLSPILEMSQEGTHSSVSSGSSVSSAVNTLIEVTKIPGEVISASRTLAGVANTTGINEDTAGDVCSVKCCVQLHRQLLQPFQDLFSSSANFYQEAVPMPRIQEQVDVKLGFESYYIEKEVVLDEDNKIYLGVSMDATTKAVKRVAIKVDSQPDPWDFYIHLQLKERLGVEFQEEFEKCSCFLYQDGYVMLYREMTCNSILGIIGDVTLSQNVVMVLAYHLLRLVEKLHTAEIIHGNLYPQTLFLVDGIPEILACDKNTSILKLVDFSHSVDMKLQPSASLSDFPVAETEQAQQILSEQSSPYQVDLLGIAQIVHLLLHGEHLQVHQEDYKWKLNQTVPKYASSELWARFFERILNTEGASTVSVLRELGEEMKPPGSAFQDPEYFFLMSLHLHTV
ncbi:mitotic checkpoint serine/threonine-protein kinase BUB1 beta [Rhinatrema bivittatum]|uniref:mitotic checkpoint serine/threonine-protein kinase BUB1 beta n=1 Tax=Rhinatrema bivittatum TaxID=194408 RepID=UPI00112A1B21|nr:mitotic checkpoint serine/threonine-protein kinase BUB1 beta [Rhinatrema bivittatum]